MESNLIDITLENLEERAVLIAVNVDGDENEVFESLEELEELASTAGAKTVLKVIQNRHTHVPGTYLGKGKVQEIKESVHQYNINLLICDDELSSVQLKNLESELGIKVIDRTILILDIFAKHAHTKEGILQVELAQQRYRLSRLSGMGESMSRLGGGIGTRGPGEKKLETDRRYIRSRISILKAEMFKMKQSRDLLRDSRKKQGKPLVAIVGYTNAGKSTLLNRLTNAAVLEEDKLFATLDPTTRKLEMPAGTEVLLTDTVGFIRKLPHQLVEAFKSTLEESIFADILIHVVDASNPQVMTQMDVVYKTLTSLGAKDKTVITVFNKMDREAADGTLKDLQENDSVYISAKTGAGIDQLLELLDRVINSGMILVKTTIPYDQGSILQQIREYGQIIVETYENDGTYIEAYLEEALVNKFQLKN